MDLLRCNPERLPTYLYRVQYPSSQTYETDSGLFAQDDTTIYGEHHPDEFAGSVTKQFTCSSRHQAPYVSLFSDKEHATNWAREWSEQNEDECEVLTVVTEELRHTYVFKLETLIQDLDVQIPARAS